MDFFGLEHILTPTSPPNETDMSELSYRGFTLRALFVFGLLILGAITLALLLGLPQAFLMLFGAVLCAILLDGMARIVRAYTPLGQLLSVIVSLLSGLGLIVGGSILIYSTMGAQFSDLIKELPKTLQSLQLSMADTSLVSAWSEAMPPIKEMLSSSGRTLELVTTGAGTLVRTIANLAVVVLIGFYLALEPSLYADNALYLLPEKWHDRGREVLCSLGQALRGWLIGRLSAMALIAILASVGLFIVDMPGAIALGALSGLICFIPYVGPFVAAVPPILLALTLGSSQVVSVLVVYGILQFIETNLITPLIQRKTVSLPPALLVTSQLICYFVFGLLGIVLATPVMVTVMVVVQLLYVQDVLGHDVQILGSKGNPAPSSNQ